MIRKEIGSHGRVVIEDMAISEDLGSPFDLGNLPFPKGAIEFRNITFSAPVTFENSEFAHIKFRNCRFSGAKLDETTKPSINLINLRAQSLGIEVETNPHPDAPNFILDARDAVISGHVRLHFFGNDQQKAPAYLYFERARIGQTSASADLIITNRDTSTSEKRRFVLNLGASRITGDFKFSQQNEIEDVPSGSTPLALNAESLRVGDTMDLRDISFMYVEDPTPKQRPALCLVRSQISRFFLSESHDQLFPEKPTQLTLSEFRSRNSSDTQEFGLKSCAIGRVSLIDLKALTKKPENSADTKKTLQEISVPEAEGAYWKQFIEKVEDFKLKAAQNEDELELNERIEIRRIFSTFAHAIQNGQAPKAANILKKAAIETDLDARYIRKYKLGSVIKVIFLCCSIFVFLFLWPFKTIESFKNFTRINRIEQESYFIHEYLSSTLNFIGYTIKINGPIDALRAVAMLLMVFAVWWMGDRERRAKIKSVLSKAFQIVTFNAIADGIEPLNAITYVASVWVLGTIMFTGAAYNGLMAPDDPAVFHNQFELLMVQEISDFDDMLTIPVLGCNSDDDCAKENIDAHMNYWRRAEYAFYQGLHKKLVEEYVTTEVLHGSGETTAEELKAQVEDYLWNIPLGAFHAACRLNWAMPSQINPREWNDAILNHYQGIGQLDSNIREKIHGKMVRDRICERLLPAEYSSFIPALYALDVTLPLLDLRLEEQWSVRVTRAHDGGINPLGFIAIALEAVLITAGWLFALILAGALTRLADQRHRQ